MVNGREIAFGCNTDARLFYQPGCGALGEGNDSISISPANIALGDLGLLRPTVAKEE